MSLDTPVSVRFPPQIKARLSAVSSRTGVGEAALIRLATEEFLKKVEETKSITINVVDEIRENGNNPKKKK